VIPFHRHGIDLFKLANSQFHGKEAYCFVTGIRLSPEKGGPARKSNELVQDDRSVAPGLNPQPALPPVLLTTDH
jgi:hypothetical protein